MTTLSSADQEPVPPRPRPVAARPTMREVAALAGVSLKTVSRVVNRESGVSPELVARVEAASHQLDYRPNLTASNLRRADQRTRTVGLIVEDVANPFFADVHRGVEDVASARGVAVMSASLDRAPESEPEVVAAFASRRVDGLILGPTAPEQDYLASELRGGLPVVCVDRVPRGVDVDVVLTNNEEATHAGVEHLLAQGHRRIAYLGGDATLSTAHERYAGYLAAMNACGAEVRPEWARLGALTTEDAMGFARHMLAGDVRPTAFMSAQNLVTMGVVRALREVGLHRSIAVVGFDDFSLADLLEPAVTVVAQDPREMGRRAAEILFRRIEGSSEPASVHIIPSRLVTRGSGEIRPE